jgi:hypothetical protein
MARRGKARFQSDAFIGVAISALFSFFVLFCKVLNTIQDCIEVDIAKDKYYN